MVANSPYSTALRDLLWARRCKDAASEADARSRLAEIAVADRVAQEAAQRRVRAVCLWVQGAVSVAALAMLLRGCAP